MTGIYGSDKLRRTRSLPYFIAHLRSHVETGRWPPSRDMASKTAVMKARPILTEFDIPHIHNCP